MSGIKTAGRELRQIKDPATRRLLETILRNIDNIDNRLISLEEGEESEWFDTKLLNGWVQYGYGYENPQYTVSKEDTVRLHGLIKSGTTTSGTVLFNLPAGVRPKNRLLVNVQSNDLLGRIDILPGGDVILISGSSGWIALDNISFEAYR